LLVSKVNSAITTPQLSNSRACETLVATYRQC
jgi:hypothetical protein